MEVRMKIICLTNTTDITAEHLWLLQWKNYSNRLLPAEIVEEIKRHFCLGHTVQLNLLPILSALYLSTPFLLIFWNINSKKCFRIVSPTLYNKYKGTFHR